MLTTTSTRDHSTIIPRICFRPAWRRHRSTIGRSGLSVVLFMAGAAGVSGCGGSDAATDAGSAGTTVAAPVDASAYTGPPQIKFDRLDHDFGAFLEIDERSTSIPFQNIGGELLVINEVRATCGCTVPSLAKREYAPGERGQLNITFDPTGPGEQTKQVSIMTNAPTAPRTQINVRANVGTFVEIEPRMAQFATRALGDEHQMVLKVTSPDPDFVIERVSASNEYATARHLTGADVPETLKGVQVVEVTVSDQAPWGGHYGVVDITVRGRPTKSAEPVTHTSSIRFAVEVFGALRGVPNTLRFGGKQRETFSRSIEIRRPDGRPFAAEITASDTGALLTAGVRLEQTAPHVYKLTLDGTTRSEPRSYEGFVEIQTDVPGEELIRVPIVGIVRGRNL